MPGLVFELGPGVLFILTLFLIALDLLYQATTPIHGVRPLIITGPNLGDMIRAISGPLTAAQSWLDQQLWSVIRGIWAWQTSHTQFLNAIGVHVESTHNALSSIAYLRIPAARAAAHTEARQVYHDSLDYSAKVDVDATHKAAAAQANAVSYARTSAQAVDHHAVDLTRAANEYSRQLSVADQGFAKQLSAADQAFAQSIGNDVIAYAHDGLLNADQFAQKIGAAAIAYTDTVTRALTATLQGIEQRGFADTRAVVGAAVGPLSAALAGTQALAKDLENSKCIKFCDPLGNLGQDLSLIDLALLLGLVAEVARDPDAVRREAQAIAGDLEGVGREALSLVGVK